MRGLVLLAVALVAVAPACTPRTSHDGGTESLGELCSFVGNEEHQRYCLTTFIQILAHPDRFDGQRALFQGRVINVDGVLAIFPSIDAVEGVELHSSIVLVAGSKLEELKSVTTTNPTLGPRRLTIGGVFKVTPTGKEGQRKGHSRRLGALYEIEELRP